MDQSVWNIFSILIHQNLVRLGALVEKSWVGVCIFNRHSVVPVEIRYRRKNNVEKHNVG